MKGMIRRIGVMIMAAALFVFTACSTKIPVGGQGLELLLEPSNQESSVQNKQVLRLWSFHQAKEFEFWQMLAKRYQAMHPNVEIKVEYISSDDYFHGTRLLSSFAAGQGPDIFFVSPGTIKRFADANVLYPLTPLITQEIKNDFYPTALEAVTLNGQIYAIPIENELLGLYYNTELFRQKGIHPPQTWSEMKSAAKALRSEMVSGLTIETFGGVYQTFSWLPFLWQTGADLIHADGNRSGLEPHRAGSMFTFFRGMIDQGLLNMQPSRPTTDIGILADGETAMQVSGTWNIRMLETQYKDSPISVVPLPVPDGGESVTIAGGWKIAVNGKSSSAMESARFVMWAFAGDTDIPLQWCSETKFAYSPRKSVMEAGKDYYRQGLRAVFTDQIFGKERQESQLPKEINYIFTDALQQLLYQRGESSAIVQAANERINRYFAAPQK